MAYISEYLAIGDFATRDSYFSSTWNTTFRTKLNVFLCKFQKKSLIFHINT